MASPKEEEDLADRELSKNEEFIFVERLTDLERISLIIADARLIIESPEISIKQLIQMAGF